MSRAFTLSIALPFDTVEQADEFCTVPAMAECARAAEAAGFWAGTVTDHPLPSERWLLGGGRNAQDPFVTLSMVAALTTSLRVQTDILVLPYRNPFITARMVASLDHFSGGRVVFGMGAGFLKTEFQALGADFNRRNELMDEYIDAMKLAWTGQAFAFQGTGYAAPGNRMLPAPAQTPHPPLLIGGNSKRALRRAAEKGDAWHPFMAPAPTMDKTWPDGLESGEQLSASIAYLHRHCEELGRQVPPKVILSSSLTVTRGFNRQEVIDDFARLRSLGVHGAGISVEARSRREWIDIVGDIGEHVISALD